MRLKTAVLATACLAICAAPASALAKAKPATTYYLSLGDSLAAGAQPNAAGKTLATNHGYADFLYKAEKAKLPGLKLKKLGCLGESTTSMLNGGPFCPYSDNQLGDAVKFIKTHRIALITLDIGANDVDRCVSGITPDFACVSSGVQTIKANVPKILAALRDAAGGKVKIAGMSNYDPFLADYLVTGGQMVARESVALSKTVNGALTDAFAAKHVKVADVATAFKTYTPFTTTGTLHGTTEPLAVVDICRYTFMCRAKPNIHATTLGYKTIAGVFAAKL